MSFDFKRFHIDDSHTAMKVGTDGVLIGAWVPIHNIASVLDVGAGSGIVSLIIAQRTENESVTIDSVEIDQEASIDCRTNFGASPWPDRLKITESSFCDMKDKYDLIVSNPPFFNTDLQSPDIARATARHAGELNYFTLLDFASRQLTANGRVAFIADTGTSPSDIIYHAEMRRLKLRNYAEICTIAGNKPLRIMYSFERIDGPIVRDIINIRNSDGHTFTDDYINLTQEYYLHY